MENSIRESRRNQSTFSSTNSFARKKYRTGKRRTESWSVDSHASLRKKETNRKSIRYFHLAKTRAAKADPNEVKFSFQSNQFRC